jgi:hypothetical protein
MTITLLQNGVERIYEWHGKPYSQYLGAMKGSTIEGQASVQCPKCNLGHLLGERKCKEVTHENKSLKVAWKHGFNEVVPMFHVCPRCECSWYFTGKVQKDWKRVQIAGYAWDD